VRVADKQSPTALFRHPSMPEMQLALRVLDVSATGCSMWLPANVPPLQPGTELTRVVVVLDETTRFTAAVKLQHVTALSPSDPGVRLGCEWEPSSPASARTLQRWVDAAQRRSRIFTLT
jgi:c-di-GMP-binding flagellar brake protein YcgR